jgi:gluconolactonase
MKTCCSLLLVFAVAGSANLWAAQGQYTLGPDSQRQPGVPRGTVTHHTWTSTIFPGTARDYWVYVPAEYKPGKPACVMVFQDGGSFVKDTGDARVPVVFDNLIYKREMPVTIGIFVNPGVLPATSAVEQNRYNRSFEYDSLSGRYARFLLQEILPEVGRDYNLSHDPNDRAIGGISSGGICAFTVAWRHPEAFRRVLSFVGSFTDLRGGDVYSALIRKTEPKPLRVFLQDGTKDLNIYAGNWYLSAQSMASALEYAGYEVKFVTGTEDHNMKQGGAILPDALRWLWSGYPKPIAGSQKPRGPNNQPPIMEAGQDWKLVASGYRSAGGLTSDGQGDVFFSSVEANRIYEISAQGKVSIFSSHSGGAADLTFGPGGNLYACQPDRISAFEPSGKKTIIAKGVHCTGLVVTAHGGVYFAESRRGQIDYLPPGGSPRMVYEQISNPDTLTLSPDQSLLIAGSSTSRWLWSFQIQPDGSLADGELFYGLESPEEPGMRGARGLTVDTDGYTYVTTPLGIQVCDQPGRVVSILDKPGPGMLSSISFGGPSLHELFVVAGGNVYRRTLARGGVPPSLPEKPPIPHL